MEPQVPVRRRTDPGYYNIPQQPIGKVAVVKEKEKEPDSSKSTIMPDDEFQLLRSKYEEACRDRYVTDKQGNRIPTWKDGLASVVPPCFRPYCQWADMITKNLKQKGFKAPYNPAVGHDIMAEIAKCFGSSFYKVVPEDALYDLQATLDFLSSYDRPVTTTLRTPPMGNIEIKPSITFAARTAELRDQNPMQDEQWMTTLAWANVVDKLPITIRCTPTVVDVQGIPNKTQLTQIDRLFEEYQQAMIKSPDGDRINYLVSLVESSLTPAQAAVAAQLKTQTLTPQAPTSTVQKLQPVPQVLDTNLQAAYPTAVQAPVNHHNLLQLLSKSSLQNYPTAVNHTGKRITKLAESTE